MLALSVAGVDASNPQQAVETIGTSREGRPIELTILADPIETAHERPAVLVVAGLDGGHRVGPELTRALIDRLGARHAEILDEVTFYLLPLGNPDGAAGGRRGNAGTLDLDRDGMLDEDPPRDLDGNGMITMMRRAAPPLDDPATHLPDPADPRLMIEPDPARSERATHTLYIEGIDADGDGLIGEDGPDGVDPLRNFMHRWPEYEQTSGPFPLSENASEAIASFVLSRPNLIAAVVYGPHDNLIRVPDTDGRDRAGGSPRELAPDDKDGHLAVSERYRALTGQIHSEHTDDAGSLHGWLYAYRGIPAYASTGWGRPEAADPVEEIDDELPTPRNPDDALWLAYSDQVRDGSGFVEWSPFEHPQLGAVEIGGWVPGFRSMPPEGEIETLAAGHAEWIAELARNRAIIETSGPEIETIAGDLSRIRIGLRNVGRVPTRTHQATRNRANRPTNIRLDCDPELVIEGRMLTQVERIEPGELVVLEWTVRNRPDRPISITVEDPVLAASTLIPVVISQ